MGKINFARVVLGGLLAGLIINVGEYVLNTFILAEQSSAIMERLGLAQIGTDQILWFVILTFVVGIVLVWVYAGFRPRFGAGVKTAIIAAVTIWIVGLISAITDVIIGIVPANVLLIAGIWSLVEVVIATIAGAWVYKESV